MYDACKYVDVFYGNGESDRFFDDGLASKWFYIKAICGNTVPHAVLPFGRMSVGPFSGGYSSGYGTHFPNGCGGIRKLSDKQTVRGFSHLHQSGVGGMKFYYNYVIASPIYGGAEKMLEFRELQSEEARPGYYKCELDGIKCELTVDGGVAVHRYTFEREEGRVAVDLSNNGLSKSFSEGFRGTVENETVELVADNEIVCEGDFAGVHLYFCVKAEGKSLNGETLSDPLGAIFDFEGNELVLRGGSTSLWQR